MSGRAVSASQGWQIARRETLERMHADLAARVGDGFGEGRCVFEVIDPTLSVVGSTVSAMNEMYATWNGVLMDRDHYPSDFLRSADQVADAAKAGDWESVFALVDDDSDSPSEHPEINQWRPGGTSWFTPLHQAAWLGAPEEVVAGLLTRGAWLSLVDSHGRRPVDIARERGHLRLLEMLEPTGLPGADRLGKMNRHLVNLIEDVARPALEKHRVGVRHPDVALLFEDAGPDQIWFPIPGMAGGFLIEAHNRRVHVESWSRVVGGSGLYHVITEDRVVLVEEGFV